MIKLSKKVLTLLLAMIMGAGTLTGCGDSNKAVTIKEETVSETQASETETEAAEVKDNKIGGSIKAVADASPITLFLPASTSTNDRFYCAPAAESLGRLQADGTTTPWLAEAFITDAENLTFTIKLREGVYFHDDSICDAEAVKWNLDKMIENGKESELDNPVSIEVKDNLTVEIKYAEWSNNWDTVIGEICIISKAAYEKNGEEWCKVNVVGTGPFIFDSYVQDSTLKFVRNDKYRIEGKPYLDSFEFVVIKDMNTQISAFLNGEIDVMTSLDSVVVNNLKQAGFENLAAESANLSTIKYVLFNSKDETKPLGDLRVRQAVMHAMDWENVAKSLSGGLGYSSPLFCTPDSWAFNKEAEYYKYDIEEAKALLSEAGYPDGFSTIINTISTYNDTAVALQASLSKIGITAEINTMDSSALAEMQKKDNIEGFIIGRGSGQMDFTNNYIRLYSTQGIKNLGIMLFPKDYEDALFGARAAKTLEEKKALLQKASKMLVQDYCMLFPTAVIYTNCFEQKDVTDLGYFQASAIQFTPEDAYRQK